MTLAESHMILQLPIVMYRAYVLFLCRIHFPRAVAEILEFELSFDACMHLNYILTYIWLREIDLYSLHQWFRCAASQKVLLRIIHRSCIEYSVSLFARWKLSKSRDEPRWE